MKLSLLGPWLWQNRRVLITAVLSYGLCQAIFYLPQFLVGWIIGLLLVLTLGVWWVSGFSRNLRQWVWLLLQTLWIIAGGLGFVIFNLLSPLSFQFAAALILIVIFWLMVLYESYLSEGSWPVWSFSILDFLDLMAFFLVSSSLFLAADLFSLDIAWVLFIFPLQVILAINLRFWREKIKSRRKWFYAILTGLIAQEVLWVMSFWHRGVFLKAFLISLIFYLFNDFIMHYIRGSLTVSVVVEYFLMVAVLLVAIFLIDWIFVLQ